MVSHLPRREKRAPRSARELRQKSHRGRRPYDPWASEDMGRPTVLLACTRATVGAGRRFSRRKRRFAPTDLGSRQNRARAYTKDTLPRNATRNLFAAITKAIAEYCPKAVKKTTIILSRMPIIRPDLASATETFPSIASSDCPSIAVSLRKLSSSILTPISTGLPTNRNEATTASIRVLPSVNAHPSSLYSALALAKARMVSTKTCIT